MKKWTFHVRHVKPTQRRGDGPYWWWLQLVHRRFFPHFFLFISFFTLYLSNAFQTFCSLKQASISRSSVYMSWTRKLHSKPGLLLMVRWVYFPLLSVTTCLTKKREKGEKFPTHSLLQWIVFHPGQEFSDVIAAMLKFLSATDLEPQTTTWGKKSRRVKWVKLVRNEKKSESS